MWPVVHQMNCPFLVLMSQGRLTGGIMEVVKAGTPKIVAVKIRKIDFDRHWVCNVVRSGYHNDVHCGPRDPHDAKEWRCGYRNEFRLSLTDEQMENWT